MIARQIEIVKSIKEVQQETGTKEPRENLVTQSFWRSCRAGDPGMDMIVKEGLELEFTPTEDGQVEAVTIRLNATWRGVLQRAIERWA